MYVNIWCWPVHNENRPTGSPGLSAFDFDILVIAQAQMCDSATLCDIPVVHWPNERIERMKT